MDDMIKGNEGRGKDREIGDEKMKRRRRRIMSKEGRKRKRRGGEGVMEV